MKIDWIDIILTIISSIVGIILAVATYYFLAIR